MIPSRNHSKTASLWHFPSNYSNDNTVASKWLKEIVYTYKNTDDKKKKNNNKKQPHPPPPKPEPVQGP